MRDPELTKAIEEAEDSVKKIKACFFEICRSHLHHETKTVGGNILRKELEKWINTIADLKAMENEEHIH